MRLSIQKLVPLFTTVALGGMLQVNAQDNNVLVQGYTFEQEWKSEAVPKSDEIVFTDYRQGFGQDNQFFIQNKNANGQKIEIYNQNGYVRDFYESGYGSNITKDEAGNILVRTGRYPRPYNRDKNIRIIKADGSESVNLVLPDTYPLTRGDYWGFATGDVFSAEGGTLAYSSANEDNIYFLEIKSGQVTGGTKVQMPYKFGLQADTYFSSDGIVNSWRDVDGDVHYLAINSNENPIDIVLDANNNPTATTIDIKNGYANFGTCTGANCFAFNGKNYIMFSTQPNWNDGFVIAELGTNDAGDLNGTITVVAQHINYYKNQMGDNISSKCDWLNWEPRDEKSVYIYQYFPGYYMARYIFGIETDETPLETIVNDGEVNETYTIADDILGVYIAVKDPTKVYAKDYGKHRHPSKPVGEQIDFIKINTTLESKNEWDQSNWVLLDFGSEEEANKYVGKVIKGGTLTGVLTNKLNPTMTVTESIEPEETGEYVENNYVASNFMTPNVQTGIEWHGTTGDYFFVEPKPQEYVKVNWALYDGKVGNYEHFSLKTTSDFKGSFNVDWSLYPYNWQEDFKEGNAYNFHAIVRYTRTDGTMQSPPKAENSATEGLYMVFPLEGGAGLITGIDEVAEDAQVIGVTYVNVMGMQNLKPWPGINIVVTRYSNGTTQVRKELHR